MNPVTFDIAAGAIPENFEGGLQDTLNLFAERLIIRPSVPWTSFVQGPAQPSSNVGPWFKDGQELRVWSDVLGVYVPVSVRGDGILPATLPLSAIEDLPPQQVLISDINGRASYIGGAPGQTIQVAASGTPVFSNPATGQLFSAAVAAAFPYPSDGNARRVPFANAFGSQALQFDVVAHQFKISAELAGRWFFYAALQIDDINAPSASFSHTLNIARNGGLAGLQGGVVGNATAVPITGISACGIFDASENDTFEVQISSTSSTPSGNEFQVNANGALTRFGGFRLM
jgi:hypothetical protein